MFVGRERADRNDNGIDIAKLGSDKQAFVFGDVLKTIYKLKLGEYDLTPPSKIILFVDELNKFASKDTAKNSPILRQILDATERGRLLGIACLRAHEFPFAAQSKIPEARLQTIQRLTNTFKILATQSTKPSTKQFLRPTKATLKLQSKTTPADREFCALRDELSLENFFKLPKLTDSDAALIEKYRLIKVRKLNRSIGNYLKKLYNFRCRLCGRNIGAPYGVNVVECHHINYFVESLDNDADNLLIVCPNHHRIIHAANPTFDHEKKFYCYQNGCEESLLLNLHL